MFDLENNVGYVKITYDDGTCRVMRTTFNQNILNRCGITDLGENLYDLDSHQLIPIEGSIEVFENKPEVDDLNAFINGFL